MLENQFWNLLKKHLPGDVSRIENSADSGTPDVTGAWRKQPFDIGIDFWIELKICSNKKIIRQAHELCNKSQLIWHFRRGKQGSLIFVMVRYPFGILVYKWAGFYSGYPLIKRFYKVKGKIEWAVFKSWFTGYLTKEIKRRK